MIIDLINSHCDTSNNTADSPPRRNSQSGIIDFLSTGLRRCDRIALEACRGFPLSCLFAFFGLWLCTFAISALAADIPQHALVIGNSDYVQRPLANPRNDSTLMSETLGKLGFKVTQANDLNRKQLFDSVNRFAESLPQGAIAFVYYAGHGMQINDANYLLPVDLALTSEQATQQRAYPLQSLIDKLTAARSAVNIVVLDACRDNPFQPPARYRSFSQLGLARTVSPQGMILAYATAPGQQAPDGTGANSLYTETLSAEMLKPGQSIEKILKNVAHTLRRKTFEDQQPWYESSLVDDYFFLPPDGIRIVTRAKPVRVVQNAQGNKRGAQAQDDVEDSAWYLQLGKKEWSMLDWEIGQRVKRMSRDEVPLLEQRAESGNVVAQTTLGIAYREGIDRISEYGTSRTLRANPNNSMSLYWLRRAADAGFPMAQVELGEMYYAGHGVDRDWKQARRYLEQAARVDYPRARLDLAQIKAYDGGGTAAQQKMLEDVLTNSLQMMNGYVPESATRKK